MKPRILPFMAISFALLLAGRAAIVSSTVINADEGNAVTPAHNKSDGSTHVAVPPHSTSATTPHTPTNNYSPPQDQCLTGELASILRKDIKVLALRTSKIEKREVALEAMKEKIAQQLKIVEAANVTLDSRINILKSYANEDISHLVKMYETMKAKQAAEIFNSMAPAFAAGFLREMNSNKAGLIMASMEPRKSYAISIIIAGRNASYRE